MYMLKYDGIDMCKIVGSLKYDYKSLKKLYKICVSLVGILEYFNHRICVLINILNI